MRARMILILATLFAANSAWAGLAATEDGIEFSYVDPGAGSVSVAGEFNGWDMNANPMTNDGSGRWSTVVPLDAGSYEYKFVVNGGTWLADPDNPVTGGDYGNSILEVGPDGALITTTDTTPDVQPSGTFGLSNTSANTRVVLGGFFRMLMESTDGLVPDQRLRIDRPQDQFNLDVTANINEKVWGTARVQVRTDRDNFNEVFAELYKVQANFEDEGVLVKAFYNEEVYRQDDPFGFFDGGDLRGTIETEAKALGQGRQGVMLAFEPFGTDFRFFYADTYDEDIFGRTDLNRNTGTDVLGGRWSIDLGPGELGASYKGILNDWWVNFSLTDNTATPGIQDLLDNRATVPNEPANWFEMSSDQHLGGLDYSLPIRDRLTGVVGGAVGRYDASFDVFNKATIQGSEQANGEIDVPVGDETWYQAVLGLDYEEETWSVGFRQHAEFGDGMDADEQSVAYRMQPSSLVEDADAYAWNGIYTTYTNPNGNDDLNVYLVGPNPERTVLTTDLYGEYRYEGFTFALQFQRLHRDLSYANFFPSLATPDAEPVTLDAERFEFRTRPSVRWTGFENPRHHVTLQAQVLEYSNPAAFQLAGASSFVNGNDAQSGFGHFLAIESSEYVLSGRVPADDVVPYPLDVRFDLRFVDYRGDGNEVAFSDGAGNVAVRTTDDESFFQPFVSLMYVPTDNLEIEVGYGVDPRFYDVIDARGWDNGRYRFREDYLRSIGQDPFHPLGQIAAEKVLEDRNQFVINALLRF